MKIGLKRAGHKLQHDNYFDTLKINCGVAGKDILEKATQREVNLRIYGDGVVSTDRRFSAFMCEPKLHCCGCRRSI